MLIGPAQCRPVHCSDGGRRWREVSSAHRQTAQKKQKARADARVLFPAGTLMTLAKSPASTIQILGAEKALFRALKTKHATPKYGLIFHASLVGQASPKNKGKVSRVLAAKCALAIRVDALGDTADATIGLGARATVEARLRQMEGHEAEGGSVAKAAGGPAKYDGAKANGSAIEVTAATYNADADVQMDEGAAEKPKKKKVRPAPFRPLPWACLPAFVDGVQRLASFTCLLPHSAQ